MPGCEKSAKGSRHLESPRATRRSSLESLIAYEFLVWFVRKFSGWRPFRQVDDTCRCELKSHDDAEKVEETFLGIYGFQIRCKRTSENLLKCSEKSRRSERVIKCLSEACTLLISNKASPKPSRVISRRVYKFGSLTLERSLHARRTFHKNKCGDVPD